MASRGSQTSRDVLIEKKFPAKLALKLGAVGVGLLVLAIIFGPPAWRSHRARRDSRAIVTALELFTLENGAFPKGSYADICAMLRGESRDGQNPKKLDYIEASASEMNSAGEFVDPWGTPYRIDTSSKLRIYSLGPNKQDNNGTGDDLGSWQ